MIEFHKKWITNSCLIIKENCQKINMLDQEIGDGDHGTTILRGLEEAVSHFRANNCLLYTSPSPRDVHLSRMPSSA